MNDPKWLTTKEAADLLGVRMHSVKRVPSADLPYWRFGARGDRKYAREDVLGYIERRMVR